MLLLLNKLESPSPKNALCQVKMILAWWFWNLEKIFTFCQCFFAVLLLSSFGIGHAPSFKQT